MSIENNPEKKKAKQEGLPSENINEENPADYAEHIEEGNKIIAEQAQTQKHEDEEQIEEVRERLAADSGEAGPEAHAERVRERYQEEREGILEDKFSRGVVDNGLNLIPFVGGARMMYESVRGKDSQGNKLTGTDRIIHGALGTAAFTLDFTGIGEVATEGVFLGKAGVQAVEGIATHLRENRDEKGANIYERTAQFMKDHPEATERAEKNVDDGINNFKRTHSSERMAA